jgi:DnaJ-class molecular chaperone
MAFYNTYERKYTEENQSPRQTQTHIPRQVSTPKSSFPECFTILGFDKIPTEQELKKRFRELAKENHPDRGGDPVKFEEISKAHNDAMKLIKNM